ncbi:LysE family translocator [Sulfurospirillum arcachonense]|uniref:LysE family translocator n=1 Tax=Sulfurospirillum arcachonense TaxID=57666 RepID=UPI0004686A60|nr:LysE family translocator [Sulfurospirillum arcachonense]
MDFLTIMAFSGALFIFMASPGPGTFAIIARALGSGFNHAFSMSLGIVLGDLIFLLMAIFGLNAIANMMGEVFIIVKYIGGIYLLYLGYKIFTSKANENSVKNVKSISYGKDFITGLFVCLSNPKVILFYLGFLPTFIDLNALTTSDIWLVSSLVVSILTLVLGSYAYFAAKAKKVIKRPKTQNIMNKLAGSVMLGAGGYLLVKN